MFSPAALLVAWTQRQQEIHPGRVRQIKQKTKQDRKEDLGGGGLGRSGWRRWVLWGCTRSHTRHSAPRPLWGRKPR